MLSKINAKIVANMVQKSRKIAAKMVQNRGLEEAWAALGAYRSVMVASWGFMGAFWGVLGTSWSLLGGVLGASWGVLEASRGFRSNRDLN